MNQVYYIILLSYLFFSTSLHSRVPENLAGTDIFTDIDLSQNSFQEPYAFDEKEADVLAVPQILALSNLNLCFGAELFITRVAQTFYVNGDVIRVEKDEAGNSKTSFYEDVITKRPLMYEQINPLALLMRILFYQVPDTRSLANFRVAENFRYKGDLRRTLYEWASLVAIAVRKVYEFEHGNIVLGSCKDAKAFVDAKNALRCNIKLGSLSYQKLITDCIKYAHQHDLGVWFIVRLLMAGTYELFGHDQIAIFKFYSQLIALLSEQFKDQSAVIGQLQSIQLKHKKIPSPLSIELSEETDAYTAFRLSKDIRGYFEPLTYRRVKLTTKEEFSDCFETLMRNIILKLIIQKNGYFKSDLLSDLFKPYFQKYSDMVLQQEQDAHDAWANLLVKEFAGKLLFKKGRYEVRNSLRNFFIILNKVFDLNIESLDHYESDTEHDTPQTKLKLQRFYDEINQALAKKIELTDDKEEFEEPSLLITINDIKNVVDAPERMIRGVLQSFTGSMSFYMRVQMHGDLENTRAEKIVLFSPKELKKFPYFFGNLYPEISDLKAHHVLSQLIFVQDELSLEHVCKKSLNPMMSKMVLAAIMQHYDIDKAFYYSFLSKLFDLLKELELIKDQRFFLTEVLKSSFLGAIEATKSDSITLQRLGLSLFKELVITGYDTSYQQALGAAIIATKSKDFLVRNDGLGLFEVLVKSKYYESYEFALQAADAIAKSDDQKIDSFGIDSKLIALLKLYVALIFVGYQASYEPALQVATKNTDKFVLRDVISRLFINLVIQRYEKSYILAEQYIMQIESLLFAVDPIILVCELFKVGYCKPYEFVVEKAMKLFKLTSSDHQVALHVFQILIQENHGKMIFEKLQELTAQQRANVENLPELFEDLKMKYAPEN